jgi:low affinity Fe/Cu permease
MDQLIREGERVDRAGDRFGRSWLPAIAGAVLLASVWGLTGPVLGLSDTWQLFIDTTAAVVILWTVFVIQGGADQAAS